MQKASQILLVLVLLLFSAGCTTEAEDWFHRGQTHQAMGRYEEAVAAYDKAVTLDPGYAEAWSHMGLSLSVLGKLNESEDSFSRALSLAPEDMSIYYYQALARNGTGNRAGALESLERVVSITPRSRDEAIDLHICLMFQEDLLSMEGRSEEANVSYRRAHEIMMSTI